MEEAAAVEVKCDPFEERNRYIDLCVDLFLKQENVQDVLAINEIGNPIRSTMDPDVSIKYGGMIDQLIGKSLAVVKALDDTDLEQIRIITKKHEVFILPDLYNISFVVSQAPIEEEHLEVVLPAPEVTVTWPFEEDLVEPKEKTNS